MVSFKPSAGVPSAFAAEKTKGSEKSLPIEISFGEETFLIEMPVRESRKSSSGVFFAEAADLWLVFSCVTGFSAEPASDVVAQPESRS